MEAIFAAYPFEAANFFHVVIRVGFVCGVVSGIPTAYVVKSCWKSQDICDTLLTTWLIARYLLFAAKVPLRAYMIMTLSRVVSQNDRQTAVENLLDMCRTWQWRINQIGGVVLYALFAVLLVLLLTNRGCGERSLFWICVMQLAIFVVHMASTFVWLSSTLHRNEQAGAVPVEFGLWANGASRQLIADNTRLLSHDEFERFKAVVGVGRERTGCSICIGDYTREDSRTVRLLRCGHEYHSVCIDEWLYKRRVCPMCQHSIDTPHDNDEGLHMSLDPPRIDTTQTELHHRGPTAAAAAAAAAAATTTTTTAVGSSAGTDDADSMAPDEQAWEAKEPAPLPLSSWRLKQT